MTQLSGNIDDFGMCTATLAGPLEARLRAVREAGFSQVMLDARDIVDHPQGLEAAVAAVRASGLRVTGLQTLRDFEGLTGQLHDYKVDMAKALLEMAAALGAPLLLASSSVSPHASDDPQVIARDLRKLAILAVPLGIRVAYQALSWGRVVSQFTAAWDMVCRADVPNLGLAIDLTLVDLSMGGREVDMGTAYDTLNETAHWANATGRVLRYRQLLRRVMEAEGFAQYENEWWHYSFAVAGETPAFDLEVR